MTVKKPPVDRRHDDIEGLESPESAFATTSGWVKSGDFDRGHAIDWRPWEAASSEQVLLCRDLFKKWLDKPTEANASALAYARVKLSAMLKSK